MADPHRCVCARQMKLSAAAEEVWKGVRGRSAGAAGPRAKEVLVISTSSSGGTGSSQPWMTRMSRSGPRSSLVDRLAPGLRLPECQVDHHRLRHGAGCVRVRRRQADDPGARDRRHRQVGGAGQLRTDEAWCRCRASARPGVAQPGRLSRSYGLWFRLDLSRAEVRIKPETGSRRR